MYVSRLKPADCAEVDELCRLTGAAFTMQEELERAHALVWVARVGPHSAPIAFVLVWAVADEVQLLHLGTHPQWRRRGAAHALLTTVVNTARTRAARLVLLEARRSNHAARSLYTRFGFAEVSVRQRYYADNDEDAIEMALELDSKLGKDPPSP